MVFGRRMLDQWMLDPSVTYLNHGTVGAPPRRVLDFQQALRDEIERQPSQFLLRDLVSLAGVPRTLPGRLREAAAAVARFLGTDSDDLVFVDNATAGVSAVLRSLDLGPDDEIVTTDLAYGAVANAAAFVTQARGAALRTVRLPYPVTNGKAIVDAVAAALGPRTRVVIIDHVTAESALIMPVADIADRCRARGVALLVDGAHAPGMLPLDISALGVDWYAGNLHKWAFSPRSCGFLWVDRRRQASMHPLVLSWGLGKGFVAEFDWAGTRDPTPWLAAPEGIAFLRDLGADAVRSYNHDLVWEAARLLGSRWRTSLGMSEAMVGSMATVPLPRACGAGSDAAARLRDALLFEDRIEVQLHAWREQLWVRVSAQVYNEIADVERLATAVANRC